MEESELTLEPEGDAEVPEIIIVSDALESTFVDLDGESRREQVETKLSRRERKAPGEGCEEIRNGREDFRTERGKRSAKAFVSL